MAVRVLIVEDEPIQAEDMASALERTGHEVCGVVSTCEDAERVALAERPDVIVMDLTLIGRGDGIEAARRLRPVCDFGLIFVTGARSPQALAAMRRLKPRAIIPKPVDPKMLVYSVMTAGETPSGSLWTQEAAAQFRQAMKMSRTRARRRGTLSPASQDPDRTPGGLTAIPVTSGSSNPQRVRRDL